MRTLMKVLITIGGLLALLFPALILADGMILPPDNYWMQENGQKAVIFYDKGVETLVVSATFQGNANDFGWVIPTPSKPTVAKGSDELFTSLQTLTGVGIENPIPMYGLGTSQDVAKEGVTVIETKQVDYYDVTVLSSTDKKSLVNWLKDNKYNFPSSASYILDSYINNGWYFVAMRINPESLEWSDSTNKLRTGHATPVSISFETANIVYPLKISSVVSRSPSATTGSGGTATQTPSYATGRVGQGATIETNDVFSFPADAIFTPTEGSVELWVKPTTNLWQNSGYHEFLNVVGKDGKDIFELRQAKDSSHGNVQLITYNPAATSWKTTDQKVLSWDTSQWYYIAATWSQDSAPQVYINGVAQTMEAAYSGTQWTMPSAAGGTVYISQRSKDSGSSALWGVADEVRLSSKKLSATDIQNAYTSVLSGNALSVTNDTTFLAHFDGNLTEAKTGTTLTYKSGSAQNNVIIPIAPFPTSQSSVLLYVIANNRKTLPSFSTNFANTIDKKSIENLALDDQGNPLLKPTQNSYFLTSLSRTMAYSDMTDDLFLRDSDTNTTIGQATTSFGSHAVGSFNMMILIAIGVSVVLAVAILLLGRRIPPPSHPLP